MKDDAIRITRRADIQRAIVMLDQAGEGFRTPLMRAAADGLLSIVGARSGLVIPSRFLKLERPTVVILTDDCPEATGPGRWPQIRKLLRWSNVAILHATGGQAEHYAMTAASALVMRRVLLVEMQQQHHAEWLALADSYAPRLKTLSLIPPPGDTHPRPAAPKGEVVH